MFRRFFDEGLAQTSYLLACDRTRHGVIIDPRRDIDEYIAAANQHGLTITHAIETHVHADFVSGARELAALGAAIVTGPGAGLAYDTDAVTEVADGRVLRVGDLDLTLLHTPGHTPEHISILAREPDQPDRLFTGDTLFVGAVGRPDLHGESVMRELAGALHESLFAKLLTLPDAVQIHPGHGAGSLCGAGIGTDAFSTIAQERRFNPMLQFRDREAFVAAVLGDLPEAPAYFARMKRLNRAGPAVVGLARGVDPPPAITAAVAAELLAKGGWSLDLRTAAAYGSGHATGAINVAFGPKIGYWTGWIVPPDVPIVLMVDGGPRMAADARRQLLRVGLDSIAGYVQGGFDAWRVAALPVRQLPQISSVELRDRTRHADGVTVVDVRSAREWRADHIEGALNIPVGELIDRLGEIPRRAMVATLCEGGFRSSLAASLLERAGIANLVNVVGGMTAWRALDASVASGAPRETGHV
jgi:hydroxyacylglutathione hydrolase